MSPAPKDRPYVLLNMSMSADGKIASAQRTINHFSSKRDHDNLYELRASVDAIMNGARTVDTAPIKMDSGPEKYRRQRVKNKLCEQALRVIVTGSGSLDDQAEVFKHKFSPIVVLTSERCSKRNQQRLAKAADHLIVAGKTSINFAAAMNQLRQAWKVRRLLCEGGGALNDALFRADLIDEVNLTVCPVVIGGSTSPTISDGKGIQRLADARQFILTKRKQIGGELFLTYHRHR